LLTGQDPATIENTWDEQDVNMVLLVRRAQQEARAHIATTRKVPLTQVPEMNSVFVLADSKRRRRSGGEG
jgi:hypothetical protein